MASAPPRPVRDVGQNHLAPFVIFLGILALLYFGRDVVVPVALAGLITFLLSPVVLRLEGMIGRAFAVVSVMVLLMAALGALAWTMTYQLIDVANQLPRYRVNIRNKIDAIRGPQGGAFKRASDSVKEIGREISGGSAAPAETAAPQVSKANKKPVTVVAAPSTINPLPVSVVEAPASGLQYLRELVGPVLGPLGTLGIVLVFSAFMLLKREDLRNRLLRLAGEGQLNVTTQALDDAAQRVSRYLLMQFLVNAVYGLVFGSGLAVIGVPNAPLWGVLAGLMRFIPYVGTLGAAALPILLSLAVFDGWTRPLMTFALFLVLDLIVANVIEPWLYGTNTGISSLAILVSAVVWTALWGPIGLVLSTPLTVCVVVLGRYVRHLEFLHILFGDEAVLPPESHFYQRLLAMDQTEAQTVIDEFLKERSVIDLYDLVIIPALGMAEQDRHQGALDEARDRYITQSTIEMVGDLGEQSSHMLHAPVKGEGKRREESEPSKDVRVLCFPARDDADEITAAMLSQLLEKSGYTSLSFPVDTPAVDILGQVANPETDVVCVSALPPFALIHARRLAREIRTRYPGIKLVVGLWNAGGGAAKTQERLGAGIANAVVTTMTGALEEVARLTGAPSTAVDESAELRRQESEAEPGEATAHTPPAELKL